MARLLLISILASIIALPAIAARERSHKKGLKKALFFFLAFNLFYLVSVRYLYLRFL
jgi:nitrate reductase NapE component